MSQSTLNSLGQPVGRALDGWTAPPPPSRGSLVGRHCRVEPLHPARHTGDLYEATAADTEGRIWTYLNYGPFGSPAELRSWAEAAAASEDPLFFAIVDEADGRAAGVASYLRIAPAVGSIEVGSICYPPRLQRTTAATEAMVLMMRNAFELGYRRYEWKCDAPERCLHRRRRTPRLHLRRRVPASHDLPGAEPRHGVVRDRRPGLEATGILL